MSSAFARFAFLVAALTAPFAAAADRPAASNRSQKYAILIGVNDYSPPLDKLQYCLNDMTDLKAHLMAAGFPPENVTLMSGKAPQSRLYPTKANIEGELRLRLQLANEGDLILLAFSGHGVQLEGKSYLCPQDAKLDDPAGSMVSVDEVYRELERCKANEKLLVVDACRNEPVVRGFRGNLPSDLAVMIDAPPKGLLVLSSCEVGQFSAEDAKLRHGVFMYYVMQGLEGRADAVEAGGNRDGRISLDELYYYAHERTKRHVAESHGIVQRPVMKGEIVGRFDLALVPDAARLKSMRQSATDNQQPPGVIATKGTEHALLRQADSYFRNADFENAIAAYAAIIDDSSLASDVRDEARKSRGAAYLARFVARGTKADLDKALIDQIKAGLRGVTLTVRAPSAELKAGSQLRGKLKQNQTVLVNQINGDWLWVAAVDGSDKLQGYIQRSAVLPPATPIAQAGASGTSGAVRGVGGGSNSYNNGNNNNYSANNYYSANSYRDDYETGAARSAGKTMDTKQRQLDRLYERGASPGAIRAKEREFDRAQQKYNRLRDR